MHTNSAKGELTRLTELGVAPYLVRDILHGVLAQSLNPVSCKACLGADCRTCGGSGIGGRRLKVELPAGGAGGVRVRAAQGAAGIGVNCLYNWGGF